MISFFKKHWKRHSLSITFIGTGIIATGVGIPFKEGTIFDLVTGFGLAFFTTGLYGLASGPLVEINKPEEVIIEEDKDC